MRKTKIYKFKHLKFKNSKYNSFKKLKDTPPFSYIEKNAEYFPALLEGLVLFLQTWHYTANFPKELFIDDLKDHIEEAEINAAVEVTECTKNKVTESIYNIYSQGFKKFNDFKGEVVEYLVVLTCKNNLCKIYHEPIICYKNYNNSLIEKKFLGKDCLIDVVDVHKKGAYIRLIECKANLNRQFQAYYEEPIDKKNSFKKKINNMNHLDSLLSNYLNFENTKIKVEKIFSTINTPTRETPSQCKDFKIINLLHLLQNGINDNSLDYKSPLGL